MLLLSPYLQKAKESPQGGNSSTTYFIIVDVLYNNIHGFDAIFGDTVEDHLDATSVDNIDANNYSFEPLLIILLIPSFFTSSDDIYGDTAIDIARKHSTNENIKTSRCIMQIMNTILR